jgi:hypothetical protein
MSEKPLITVTRQEATIKGVQLYTVRYPLHAKQPAGAMMSHQDCTPRLAVCWIRHLLEQGFRFPTKALASLLQEAREQDAVAADSLAGPFFTWKGRGYYVLQLGQVYYAAAELPEEHEEEAFFDWSLESGGRQRHFFFMHNPFSGEIVGRSGRQEDVEGFLRSYEQSLAALPSAQVEG